MNFPRFVSRALLLAALGLTVSLPAHADAGAQAFVKEKTETLVGLLKQPASGARDSQVTQALGQMVDYDELVRRSFGKPCPATVSGCTNHWDELTPDQQKEVGALLRQLVERNHKKNITKTIDYEITYKGEKSVSGSESRIRTEAKSKVKPRDPSVQVDYYVVGAGAAHRVVDMSTEGSLLSKNYYDQFHKMLTTQGQGYPYVVKKLRDKLAKGETK